MTRQDMLQFNEIIALITNEYSRATNRYDKFCGPHHGYGVLLEEVDELWDAIKGNESKAKMLEEAVQVASMAIRFIKDVC